MIEEKFNLKSFQYYIGNREKKQQIEALISSNSNHPILIWGPSGTGKTALIQFLAEKYNFDLIQLDIPDTKEAFDNLRILLRSPRSLDGRKKLLLLEDMDLIPSKQMRSNLASVLRAPKTQIVLIALSESVSPNIKFRCHQFEFKPLNVKEMLEFLNLIEAQESLNLSKKEKMKIISKAQGDIRSLFFLLDFGLSKVKCSKEYNYHPRKKIKVLLKRFKSNLEFIEKADQLMFLDQIERRKQFNFFDKFRSLQN